MRSRWEASRTICGHSVPKDVQRTHGAAQRLFSERSDSSPTMTRPVATATPSPPLMGADECCQKFYARVRRLERLSGRKQLPEKPAQALRERSLELQNAPAAAWQLARLPPERPPWERVMA